MYNKASHNRKWLAQKEAEEKRLRELGVDEDLIQKLRLLDWEDFKSDRRYYEHLAETDTYLDNQYADEKAPDVSVDNLLDMIDNQELFFILNQVDKLTLQILIWKMEGYSSKEISQKCGLSVSAINFRIWHIREKIKNIF